MKTKAADLAKLRAMAESMSEKLRNENGFMSESSLFVLGEELSYLNEEISELEAESSGA